MSKKENYPKNLSTQLNEKVISILPYLEKDSAPTVDILKKKLDLEDIENHLKILEMSTDDIAGSILAYYVYEVNLFEELDSADLLKELQKRAMAYLDLCEQITTNL